MLIAEARLWILKQLFLILLVLFKLYSYACGISLNFWKTINVDTAQNTLQYLTAYLNNA